MSYTSAVTIDSSGNALCLSASLHPQLLLASSHIAMHGHACYGDRPNLKLHLHSCRTANGLTACKTI